jgi:hypothetical protein
MTNPRSGLSNQRCSPTTSRSWWRRRRSAPPAAHIFRGSISRSLPRRCARARRGIGCVHLGAMEARPGAAVGGVRAVGIGPRAGAGVCRGAGLAAKSGVSACRWAGAPAQAADRDGERRPKLRNVQGAFAVGGALPPGPVLLVDDTVDSGWTLTVVGAGLREAGSGPVPSIRPREGWPLNAQAGLMPGLGDVPERSARNRGVHVTWEDAYVSTVSSSLRWT